MTYDLTNARTPAAKRKRAATCRRLTAERRARIIEALWTFTTKVGDCWEWSGKRHSHGYGLVGHAYAHRLSWEKSKGAPIPTGLLIRHTCNNPPCINPAHLVVGRHLDNARDMVAAGRSAFGERHGMAILTEAIAASIKALHRQGEPCADVARAVGFSYDTVHAVIHGDTWRCVP